MKKQILSAVLFFTFFSALSLAQVVKYSDNLFPQGITLEKQTPSGVTLTFSVSQFEMEDITLNGSLLKAVHLPSVFLPNDEGAPDLPGIGQYVAIPQGSKATFNIVTSRTEIIKNVEIAPAPRIPKDTDKGPLFYSKNNLIYSRNSNYPENPVIISANLQARGVDAVLLGVTPFQYNPVTKDLTVYKDLKIEVTFSGGNNHFGEDRLRSRWWDPLLNNIFINYSSLPVINYSNKNVSKSSTTDYEYIIITPDNPQFLPWADSIKNFREQQGIHSGVVTLTQIGGNSTSLIESYVNNAYNTWVVPPAAVLILGDYSTGGSTGNGVISPVYDSYCVSDHIYADVNGDHMAEIAFARISATTSAQLSTIIGKILKYDRQPPISPSFYDKPVTAMGFQTERWFQLCSEVVNGFWTYKLGKHPVRENAVYSGTPGGSWSTATNTTTVVNYFGPSGLNYIPANTSHLTDWGGNATRINNDINQGTFMVSHRDHGAETGWGEPAYSNSNVLALNNTDLPFILSLNCLTGKFNYTSDCFAEAFHRHQKGALGLIAATEVSYSFVNDAFCWGMMDEFWPNFMPDYGRTGQPRVYPAFGNVAGKFFLKSSNWPYNTSNKEVTYYLFHHHGDAFTSVYSEVPQNLNAVHNPVLLSGQTTFAVTADSGALIGISVNGQLIGSADATGLPLNISIPSQLPGTNLLVTITKQNFFRYSKEVPVIPPAGAYIVHESCSISDTVIVKDISGNGNGILDFGESVMLNICAKNVGSQNAANVNVKLRSNDNFVTISDSTESYGSIVAGGSVFKMHAFGISLNTSVPDQHVVPFSLIASDGVSEWISYFSIKAHAPNLQYVSFAIVDSTGNNNGRIDPGESAALLITVKNTGSAKALGVNGSLSTPNSFITVNTASQIYGNLDTNAVVQKRFTVTAAVNTPAGNQASFTFNLLGAGGITGSGNFNVVIGQIPVLVLDLDPNASSGPKLLESIQNNGIAVQSLSLIPGNLNLYTSIFVCLGIYSTNHKLTATEGQQLADFLNAGGRLYMEGGDTWKYDTPTAVHPMFNIQGLLDGSGNLAQIQGQPGSFVSGLNFTYSGENNYIDQINAISPGVLMFKNSSPSYGCAVSNIAPNYRTIGSSFEFAGLTNGVSPNTRDSLMSRYLNFFGLLTVPVELISFSAKPFENAVKLKWETATETNNYGYAIEKSTDGNNFLVIGTVQGKGTTTEKQIYSFEDKNIKGKGKLYYRLRQKDFDGTSSLSKTIEVDFSALPDVFSLSQNYPNPFNPTTTIKFGIPVKSDVTLKIYDAIGSEVATLVNNQMEPGYYNFEWNASRFSSGVYFYRIQAGSFTSVKKLLLLK